MEQKTETIKECFEQLYPLPKENRSSYDFRQICAKMEKLLRVRAIEEGETDKKIIYTNAASRVSRTISKYVIVIESYQEKMHKKNSSAKSRDEYFEAVNRAYTQIKSDIREVISAE